MPVDPILASSVTLSFFEGVGGSSAAYFLSNSLPEVDITVFESSDVGGRLKAVELAGRKYESGGSIIHNANKLMVEMLEVCQLQRKIPLAKETFSLAQKNIVFQVNSDEIKTSF